MEGLSRKGCGIPGTKVQEAAVHHDLCPAGISRSNELNGDGTAYLYDRKHKLDAGIDLKYGISSNLIFDVTVNTDFAQVEADDELVNLTRFDLYLPEKRQFTPGTGQYL